MNSVTLHLLFAVPNNVICLLKVRVFSDSADNSATANTQGEVLVVGSNDGQLREEVSGRF